MSSAFSSFGVSSSALRRFLQRDDDQHGLHEAVLVVGANLGVVVRRV